MLHYHFLDTETINCLIAQIPDNFSFVSDASPLQIIKNLCVRCVLRGVL